MAKQHGSTTLSGLAQFAISAVTYSAEPLERSPAPEAHGVYMGDLYVDTCPEAYNLLNKSDLDGKKKASDPAFNLAAQLLAAKLSSIAV